MRVGINGFGRIGRSVFRVLNNRDDIEVVAINDIFDKDALTYLLKYDTVMGRFPGDISLDSDILSAGNQKVKLLAERAPEELPWGELGVDIVIESTGIFRMKSQLQSHINAGAKKVILTVPAKDQMIKILSGELNGSFVRLSVDSGGCSGFSYKFSVDKDYNKDNDIQSGQGYVHNSLLFESPQKGVVYSKFRLSPLIDPPWFVTNKKAPIRNLIAVN